MKYIHYVNGKKEIANVKIKTSDRIILTSVGNSKAIMGKIEKRFVLFFGTKRGLITWDLDEDLTIRYKVRVVKD